MHLWHHVLGSTSGLPRSATTSPGRPKRRGHPGSRRCAPGDLGGRDPGGVDQQPARRARTFGSAEYGEGGQAISTSRRRGGVPSIQVNTFEIDAATEGTEGSMCGEIIPDGV